MRIGRLLSGDRGADLLLWLTITAPVFVLTDKPDQPGLPLPVVQIAAVPLLGWAVVVGRRRSLAAAAVPAGLALAATPTLTAGTFVIAQVLLAFRLGRRTASLRTGLLLYGAVCLAGLALLALAVAEPWRLWFGVIGQALGIILVPWLAGRYARQRDQLVRAGWELAERLEREQDLTAERMRLLERSRIAGDMHDSLGHELSLVAVRAAALQVDPDLNDATRKAVGELRESVADATERLREIIGLLREETERAPLTPAGDTIAALAERAAAAGISVTVRGALPPLPPMVDRAAYQVVRESLTNAAKHAPNAAITVALESDATTGHAVLRVVNEPPPMPPPPPAPGGHGLIGLRERVRLAGGRLQANPADGGFVVTARLPLTAHAVDPPIARRELTQARLKVRRSLFDAIWVPVVATAVLLALNLGYDFYTSYREVLDSDLYNGLQIGERQSIIESRLPAHEAEGDWRLEGVPPDPPGADECRFYRTSMYSRTPVYRLCFDNGRLSDKATVTPPPSRRTE